MLSFDSHCHKWNPQNRNVATHLGSRRRKRINHLQRPQNWFSFISFLNPRKSTEWNLSTGQMGKLRLLRVALGRPYPSSYHGDLIRREVPSQTLGGPPVGRL